MPPRGTDGPSLAAADIGYSTIALHHHAASCLRHEHSKCAYPATGAAQVTRIMQQMRSGPIQLRALAEELDARQEAKCQRREIDQVHDPSAQPDERQKSERSGETSQRLSRPPFQPRDRF